MIQVYRIIVGFEAQQLPWEPLRLMSFAPGDLVMVLRSEDSYTTFCRHEEAAEFSDRDQFVVHDEQFYAWTEIFRGE